ncbi:MAG: hypothetical protein Q8T11_00715 [Elusimicrobiota bacterium]|nr:hypothetical protein [Elusimicrobiota bacterium]
MKLRVLPIVPLLLASACSFVTPYDVAHPDQGPLYRLSPGGTQETLPDLGAAGGPLCGPPGT